jgi:hypothetical protein
MKNTSHRMQAGIVDGWILAGLGALIVAVYWPLLTRNPVAQAALAPGDLTVYYYPLITYTIGQLSKGHIPLWNPHVLGGFPHLAELQTQVLYPANWLAAMISRGEPLSYRGFAGLILGHLIWATWGAYGFFRWLIRDRVGGALGGVAWGLSGYLTGYPIQAPPILETAAWLPWLLWFIGRALIGKHPHRNGVLAALTWAIIFLAGFPQVALYIYGISLAFGIACLLSLSPERRRSAWMTGLVVVVCGSGLTCVQLLPSLESASLSERLSWPLSARATGFEVWELLGILWPHLTNWSPLYVGIPVLLSGLVLNGPQDAPFRHRAFWLSIGAIGALLSIGKESFLYPALVGFLPIWNLFRNQERAALIVTWAVITLGVLGWRGTIIPSRHRVVGLGLGIIGTLLIALFLWVQAQPLSEWPRLHRWLSSALWSWMIGGAGWLLLRDWPRSRWWIVGLLILDTGSVAWRTALQTHWVWQPPDQTARSPLSSAWIPLERREYRIDTRGHMTGNWVALEGLEDLHGDLTFINRFFYRFRAEVPGERVWALMGVGCYIRREEEAPIPFPAHRVASLPQGDHMLHLECLDEPFPRYRLIYDSVAFDDETALRALRDGRFDPLRVVILDRPWPHPSAVSTSVMSTVQLQSRKPEELQFQVQSSQAGFLVIGDVWDPGWQAVVDGQPAPVLRAYMALRAVPLPPGNHIVRLYYSPLSLRVGLLLSALSLGILVIWALQPDWFPRR